MARGPDLPIERLLDQADWLRRLARHLAGDAGDDLAQDVWLAAQRSPPDPGRPPRPWLATVLRNLAHIRHRNERRRTEREQQYQDAAPREVAAADDAYERAELQRFLAAEVLALDEPLRTVVVLRYFEGLDSGRIAEATGAPAGTVRWRLKQALERLRRALDARHAGERRAWLALLAPAAGAPGRDPVTGALIMANTKTNAALVTALLALLLLLAGGGLWWARGRGGAAPAAGAGSAAAEPPGDALTGAGGRLPAPPRLLAALGDAGAELDLAGCQGALARAREQAELREREARALVPSVAFEASPGNPRLRDEVAPQLEKLWTGTPAGPTLTHHLECRGWACRLVVVVPVVDSDEVQPRLDAMATWIGPVQSLRGLTMSPPSSLGVAFQWGGVRISEDPVARRRLEEYVFLFGSPPASPEAAPELSGRAPLPASVEDCRRALMATQVKVIQLGSQLAGFTPAAALFPAGTPAPALTARVAGAVRRVLGAAAVECRGGICRVRLGRPVDPAALARLRADEDLQAELRKEQQAGGDLYLTLGEQGYQALSRRRAAALRTPAFFAGCPAPPREGNVLLRLVVPETGIANDDGVFEHASVRLAGGTLQGTPAAACLLDRISALLADEQLPSPVGGFFRYESWVWRPGSPPEMVTPPGL
jgi:RNA polymerase sigma factor (sigma-70 family)